VRLGTGEGLLVHFPETVPAAEIPTVADVDRITAMSDLVVHNLLISLEFPGGRVLRLGQDLGRSFPLSLRTISHPELRELLARVDPTPDSLRGSGTEDWADLPDRMHFIADLFRGFQEDRALLGPPFTPEQMAALQAGRRPGGRL